MPERGALVAVPDLHASGSRPTASGSTTTSAWAGVAERRGTRTAERTLGRRSARSSRTCQGERESRSQGAGAQVTRVASGVMTSSKPTPAEGADQPWSGLCTARLAPWSYSWSPRPRRRPLVRCRPRPRTGPTARIFSSARSSSLSARPSKARRSRKSVRTLWWKPGSSNSMPSAHLKSIRLRTDPAACRSDSYSRN